MDVLEMEDEIYRQRSEQFMRKKSAGLRAVLQMERLFCDMIMCSR